MPRVTMKFTINRELKLSIVREIMDSLLFTLVLYLGIVFFAIRGYIHLITRMKQQSSLHYRPHTIIAINHLPKIGGSGCPKSHDDTFKSSLFGLCEIIF